MSSLNKRVNQFTPRTFEGGVSKVITPDAKLQRLVLACMLWESTFYLDGQTAAELIKETVAKANPKFVADLAVKARNEFKLRHVPLLLIRELARIGKLKAETVDAVIQRPDEMSELLAIYWSEGKVPLSAQLKKGIAAAFTKFNEYSLAKWDKNSASVSIRDVMFITRPKPVTDVQADMFKRLAEGKLETPDTWETKLSAGADKGDTFSELMAENKLGALAFLRNLRNMVDSGISEDTIRKYAKTLDVSKVLPFRFLAAARIVPQFEDMLEDLMFKSCSALPKLKGKTAVLVDVSGSMFGVPVSQKSDLDRYDAAAALSIILREQCEQVELYSFSEKLVRVPPRRGMTLVRDIKNSQPNRGTALGSAMHELNDVANYDRVIIITDEQSRNSVPNPKGIGYVLNVGTYENGISNGSYNTITGFSEAVFNYIAALEEN